MQKVSLKAQEREILGKKVKKLRKEGLIPAHVFGNKVETEHVTLGLKDFLDAFDEAGETGVIDLKIGEEKVRPVMIRDVQFNPVNEQLLHIDFYQVNLKEKVKVPVPIVLTGEEPESVHMGEAVVLQTISEVEVEALPTDLIENIEVDIKSLKNIDDAITVGMLSYNHETLAVLADPDEVVVKLAPAVSAEMQELLAEQEAEQAAAAEEVAEGEEGAEGTTEGDEAGEIAPETAEGEEKPVEESAKEE